MTADTAAPTIPRCKNSCAASTAILEAFICHGCRLAQGDGCLQKLSPTECAKLDEDDRRFHEGVDGSAVRQEAAEVLAEMPSDEPEEEPCS